MRYSSIVETIGNTPVVELARYSPCARVKIFAKLEGTNPAGSVKDRVAWAMIRDAQKSGHLRAEKELLEATSGNTGIGLAMLSRVFGYKFTAVVPENVSAERLKLLRMYGAQLMLTDGTRGTNYAIAIAREVVKNDSARFLMLDQFENAANAAAHYQGTGVEILLDVPEITHFVAGMGTGGTLMGVGRRLKEHKPHVKIIGVEPRAGSTIQGLRNMGQYTPPIFSKQALDQTLSLIDDEAAFELARDVFKTTGMSVGISSGAALWGALQVAHEVEDGVIVTLFPDRGDRYISTRLFE